MSAPACKSEQGSSQGSASPGREVTPIAFAVEGQPVSTNHGYKPARFGKRHGFVLTDAGQSYKARLAMAARHAWRVAGRPDALDRAVVGVRFGFKTASSDIDGPLKFTLDSLQAGGLVVNDNRIVRVLLERVPGTPRTEVVIAAPGDPCPTCGCECCRVTRESSPLDTPASSLRQEGGQ